jgi:hypothetical protein
MEQVYAYCDDVVVMENGKGPALHAAGPANSSATARPARKMGISAAGDHPYEGSPEGKKASPWDDSVSTVEGDGGLHRRPR